MSELRDAYPAVRVTPWPPNSSPSTRFRRTTKLMPKKRCLRGEQCLIPGHHADAPDAFQRKLNNFVTFMTWILNCNPMRSRAITIEFVLHGCSWIQCRHGWLGRQWLPCVFLPPILDEDTANELISRMVTETRTRQVKIAQRQQNRAGFRATARSQRQLRSHCRVCACWRRE